ncbi:MAG: hypothetical protein AB2813_06950 [Candidatus Sedimenticola endophacoides]
MERQTGKSSDQTQRHIDSTANTLVWNQLGLMGATGILILAGICTLFVLRVSPCPSIGCARRCRISPPVRAT